MTMISFLTGNSPHYEADTPYEVMGWGEQTSSEEATSSTYVFFRSSGVVLSTPIENVKENRDQLYRYLTANYPKYSVRVE